MQRVHPAVVVDGAAGGDHRLPRHLAAEHPQQRLPGAAAPEDVALDAFEVEHVVHELPQGLTHAHRLSEVLCAAHIVAHVRRRGVRVVCHPERRWISMTGPAPMR